jgi:hypothetical protein
MTGSSAGTDATEFTNVAPDGQVDPEKDRMRKEIEMLRAENEALRNICNSEGIRWQQEIEKTRRRVNRRQDMKAMGCLGWC